MSYTSSLSDIEYCNYYDIFLFDLKFCRYLFSCYLDFIIFFVVILMRFSNFAKRLLLFCYLYANVWEWARLVRTRCIYHAFCWNCAFVGWFFLVFFLNSIWFGVFFCIGFVSFCVVLFAWNVCVCVCLFLSHVAFSNVVFCVYIGFPPFMRRPNTF